MIGISTSTFYYKHKRDPNIRERNDALLRDLLEKIQAEFPRSGYRTLKKYLLRDGIRVNEKRIRRVMKKYNLHAIIKRKFINTTDSNHSLKVYPNLIREMTVTGINQVWCADITYIRILTGFVFLAVILDIFSRRVIGWSISKHLDRNLTLEALKVAIEKRKPQKGVIHHSDRGVQYASSDYIELLNNHGFHISMSNRGNPYDNAFAETFFKTLKYEEVYLYEYENIFDVMERIPYFIDEVYNKKRVHSGIKYLPPEEFENLLNSDTKKNALGQFVIKL